MRSLVLALLFCSLLGLLAIRNESLWIDEARTAAVARQPTLGAWGHEMLVRLESESEMPLYMLAMWLWDKTAGSQPEYIFRLSNMPWFLLGLTAFGTALIPWRRWFLSALLLFSVYPFIWFYLDEARPYLMQCAAMMVIVAFFIRRLTQAGSSPYWTVAFCSGLIFLCGSSMLGVLWAGPAMLLLIWCWWRGTMPLARHDWLILAGTVLLLAGLGAYYLVKHFLHHAAPTPGETGILNVAFAFYELLGCAGLGPSRAALRDGGIAALRPYVLPIALGGIASGGLFLSGLARFWTLRTPHFWAIVLAWISPIAALFMFGTFFHVRILGRHLMPAFPPLLLLLSCGLARASASGRRWLPAAALLPLLASTAQLRYAERHSKDDVRLGCRLVRKTLATGGTAWYAGDAELAAYYGMPLQMPDSTNRGALWLDRPTAERLAALSPPDLILFDRPDIYDPHSALSPWLLAHNYRRQPLGPALSLWRKEP